MAITIDDFSKIWASTSPLTPYEFSENNYKDGWNFIGGTPPSRQMWDFLQKNNDEKSQYLLNNFENYLPLSGGTLTGDVFGVTPPVGDNSKKIANTEFIQALVSALVPIGCVQAFAGNTTPQGWLLCDGSAVSRTQYSRLFGVIGTTYGAGDGTDTFNLPNLVDKFIQGNAVAGTEHSAGLPDTEVVTKKSVSGGLPIPAGYTLWTGTNSTTLVTAANGWGSVVPAYVQSQRNSSLVDADKQTTFGLSNPIYGNSTTVQPPSVTMMYIIKY